MDASPIAVIHSSYYAMFHAARAVLFKALGAAPKRHDNVIQQFGLLAKERDEAVRSAGRALNLAKDERTAADYNETILPAPDNARDAIQAAQEFVLVCSVHFGFQTDIVRQ